MKHEGKRERGGRESQLTSLVIKQEASLFAGEAIFVMGNPGMKSTSVSFKKDCRSLSWMLALTLHDESDNKINHTEMVISE
jgi:hypothetical protein